MRMKLNLLAEPIVPERTRAEIRAEKLKPHCRTFWVDDKGTARAIAEKLLESDAALILLTEFVRNSEESGAHLEAAAEAIFLNLRNEGSLCFHCERYLDGSVDEPEDAICSECRQDCDDVRKGHKS